MTERPILFSAPMVRALLDGSKTQTRRAVKPQFDAEVQPCEIDKVSPEGWQMAGHSGFWADQTGAMENPLRCPYGVPGNLLWVREAWAENCGTRGGFIYRADYGPANTVAECNLKTGEWEVDVSRWRPSIHMPRRASRITLRITSVRVERLNEISEGDARAEGTQPVLVPPDGGSTPHIEGFRALWESINGPGSWDANPWVWIIAFDVQRNG